MVVLTYSIFPSNHSELIGQLSAIMGAQGLIKEVNKKMRALARPFVGEGIDPQKNREIKDSKGSK